MPALCHRKSLFLQRTSNNYRNSSAGKGRINFLLKASCFSGILFVTRYLQSNWRSMAAFNSIEKRTLHADEMLSLKAVAFAGFHHRGQGKDTGHKCALSIRKCGVFFPAPCFRL